MRRGRVARCKEARGACAQTRNLLRGERPPNVRNHGKPGTQQRGGAAAQQAAANRDVE